MAYFTTFGRDQKDALLAALAAGMSAETAAPLVAGYQDQVAQAQQERADYLSGISQMVNEQAMGGMTEDQTQMLLRSQRLAAGLSPQSNIAQKSRGILQNAYPGNPEGINSMPGGLSPLASSEFTGGVDMEDVQSINEQVKAQLSQGVTDPHSVTMNIMDKARQGFGYEWQNIPSGTDPQSGEVTTTPKQVSLMPPETQQAMRGLIARAIGYYTERMGIDPAAASTQGMPAGTTPGGSAPAPGTIPISAGSSIPSGVGEAVGDVANLAAIATTGSGVGGTPERIPSYLPDAMQSMVPSISGGGVTGLEGAVQDKIDNLLQLLMQSRA